MIKAIIFDCFGVIYPDTLGMVEQKFLEASDARREQIRRLRQKTDLGLLSRDEFWNQAAQILGISRHELDLVLDKIRGADWTLLRYIKSLKPKYKTAMLSNVGEGFLGRIFDDEHPEKDFFDVVIASAEIAIMKPDPRSFKITAERLGVEPEECIMIDDQQRHIDGAKSVSMQGIVYKDFEQMKVELQNILAKT